MKRGQIFSVGIAAVLAAALAASGSMVWEALSPSGPSALLVRGSFATTTTTAAPVVEAGPVTGPSQTDTDKPGSKLRFGIARPVSLPAEVADAIVPKVSLFNGPEDAEPAELMANPTWEGLPVVFLVQQRFKDRLEVQVSMRPNQATIWVKASEVKIRQVANKVVVDIAGRKLTAYNSSGPLMETTVAVGAGRTPTPTGTYFIDGAVKVPNPNGPYGAYQLSVAAFSNVHKSFGGGNGQIAIHGTNNPALIGTPASNGCVRMTNDDITRLVQMVPVGTPVEIRG